MTSVIEARGVSARRPDVPRLECVDLQVEAGEVHALVGPAGAGKSALVRLLLGLIRPDAGRARVLGLDCWSQAVQVAAAVSYAPPEIDLWPQLSAAEMAAFLGLLNGPPDPGRLSRLLGALELDPDVPISQLTPAQRRAVTVAAALARRRSVVILDDGFRWLTPAAAAVVAAQIADLRRAGAGVLITGRPADRVEVVADRVSTIDGGVCPSVPGSGLQHARTA